MEKAVLLALVLILSTASPVSAASRPASTCYGTTAHGRLENGVQLPAEGPNFQTYSLILWGAGRTYVHHLVRDVVLTAYKSLETTHPAKTFVYGETGWTTGGRFKPHKTHQNGLSVDFMVPVIDEQGMSTPLPTSAFNRYGYGVEFDRQGRAANLCIDIDAMAAHIKALHVEAQKAGIGIWRVIFDPGLQGLLYDTEAGAYLKANILIPRKKSWVRHDDHYHVDFIVNCQPF